VTFYCPNCWTALRESGDICPACGYDLREYTNLPYVEKLLVALGHPVPENRMIAIQVLGKLGVERAIPAFERFFQDEREDYYILQEVLVAARKIGGARALDLIRKARQHPSGLVQRLAGEMLEEMRIGASK
jgi:HEAT repeat protein